MTRHVRKKRVIGKTSREPPKVTCSVPLLKPRSKDRRASSKEQLTHRYEALQEISVQLINARDPRDVLSIIVDRAARLLACDAGSLFLKHSEDELLFEVALNHSIDFDFKQTIVPVSDLGMAGYCFRTDKVLRVTDVYSLDKNVPFTFNKSFDEKSGYRTRSMLVHPLKSSKGEKLGVIQLINRKNSVSESWPADNEIEIATMPTFTAEDEKLLQSFAALASASIENAWLYRNIEDLFEGFVKASVDAIETRDQATRGHSERVALLTIDLAEKSTRSSDEGLNAVQFSEKQISELRYAALLHDFGKIGVEEATLLKEEKLFELQKEKVRHRIDDFLHRAETDTLRGLINLLSYEKRHPNSTDLAGIESKIFQFREEMEAIWKLILEVNRPTVLDEDKSARLEKLISMVFRGSDGQYRPLLHAPEIEALKIKRGSLSDIERLEIESHVTNTYHFLKRIPWTSEFANIPDIAYAHHEKLDGTGYPRSLKSRAIPDQARIMTICDIYDALVANDRPYKKAVPIEKALAILEFETKSGKLDPRFFKVFVEARIYENPEFIKLTDIADKKAA